MRNFIFIVLFICTFQGYSQTQRTTLLSAIVVGPDSLPVPGVAIINTRTGKVVRTDQKGFFQTNITGDDSLFVYHISYKHFFIDERASCKTIVLEQQFNEIGQVEVTDNSTGAMKNLQKTLQEIKQKAPEKSYERSNYSEEDRQSRFLKQNGTHDKGFKESFGPRVQLPIDKIIASVEEMKDKREQKKLTSHYHVVKRKVTDKEK